MPPKAKFSKDEKRAKDLDLLIPGLNDPASPRRGRNKDRFRVSSETRVPRVFAERKAMIRDLASRLLFPLLRARLEGRFTTQALHDAYRAGDVALERLLTDSSGERLAPLLDRYMAVNRTRDAKKTRMQIQRFIDYCGGDGAATTADLTTQRLAEFRASLTAEREVRKRTVSNATQNRYMAAVGGFCSYLIREKKLASHPKAFGALKKLDEGEHRMPDLSTDEYRRYFEEVERIAPEVSLIYRLLIHTGADVGEVLSRRVNDCELARTQPRIRYRRTKTRTPERAVPLPEPFASQLQDHIDAQSLSAEDELFGMVRRRTVEMVHERVRARMGRPDLRLKDFRHIAAISWRRAGVDVELVREWLGHATILQTVVYNSFAPNDEYDAPSVRRAAELLTGNSADTLLRLVG